MKNYQLLSTGTDVRPLLLQLAQNPDLWKANPIRTVAGSPHEQSEDIWVRYNDETAAAASGNYSTFNDQHEAVWYPAYYAMPALRPLIFDLARSVEAEAIGGVFLWRVRPGQRILPHSDMGWHVNHYEKFNICLQSQEGCGFIWPEEKEILLEKPGDITRFCNTTEHTVVNNSYDDYLVMVVCLRTHNYNRRFRPLKD